MHELTPNDYERFNQMTRDAQCQMLTQSLGETLHLGDSDKLAIPGEHGAVGVSFESAHLLFSVENHQRFLHMLHMGLLSDGDLALMFRLSEDLTHTDEPVRVSGNRVLLSRHAPLIPGQRVKSSGSIQDITLYKEDSPTEKLFQLAQHVELTIHNGRV